MIYCISFEKGGLRGLQRKIRKGNGHALKNTHPKENMDGNCHPSEFSTNTLQINFSPLSYISHLYPIFCINKEHKILSYEKILKAEFLLHMVV